jgi:hypothetical protein
VNVERVAGSPTALPCDPYECLVVDHIAETVDQSSRKGTFGWRESDPATFVSKQPVFVDPRSRARFARAGRQGRDPNSEFVFARGEANPVLERIARLERAEILPDQQQAGHAESAEPLDAVPFLRPPHQSDLEGQHAFGARLRHRGNVNTTYFGFVSPT